MSEQIFIGVAWPYANGEVHVGHIAGCYLGADIFARYQRMKGNDVLMVSGSDQHGTPITVSAEKEGVSPEEIAERYHQINEKAMDRLGISFDLYTKTHTKHHAEVVTDFFLDLLNKGYITKKKTDEAYCPECERFLPDRYVEGTCPYCGYEHARGDQCEECGRPLDPKELINPKCKICGTEVTFRETEHFFLKLEALQSELLRFIGEKGKNWRPGVLRFTENWIKSGLHDRAITRDISWGIPVPVDGFEQKRIYVWFEAVIGYYSASLLWAEEKGEDFHKFWNENAEHYYFMGKDNIPFHTIIWPAILIGRGFKTPDYVVANNYLRLAGQQFSKSRGVSLGINEILDRYDVSALRYYLTSIMPENHDSEFDWKEFVSKNNNELLAKYGNFIHRVLSFTADKFAEVPPGNPDERDEEFLGEIEAYIKELKEHLDRVEIKDGLNAMMKIAALGNKYMMERAPWKEIKENRERAGTTMNVLLRAVKALTIASHPFIPHAALKVWEYLGMDESIEKYGFDRAIEPLKTGRNIEKHPPLFSKMTIKEESSPLKSLDLRVGLVEEVRAHPDADNLYIMRVNLGKETRQIVSGLKNHYKPEELERKKIVVVANLEPARFRGEISQGMLLAAESGNVVSCLTVDADPGTQVSGTAPAARIKYKKFAEHSMMVGRIKEKIFHGDKEYPAEFLDEELRDYEGPAAAIIHDGKAVVMSAGGKIIVPDKELSDGMKVR